MYLVAGIGGVIGALLRYFILIWFIDQGYANPAGTLCVNLIGCFILGYLQGIANVYELPGWLVGLGGFLGATSRYFFNQYFSTFNFELFMLKKNGRDFQFFLYIVSSYILGIFLAYLGYSITSLL